jgi:hypothetical protein
MTYDAQALPLAGKRSASAGNEHRHEDEPRVNLQAFKKPERLTVPGQTKFTPTEHARILHLRDALVAQGVDNVSVSSLIRGFTLTGLEALETELGIGQ